MEINTILHADLLDIVFEGRNKEYGAYDLRKTYNRRLIKALGVTGSVILLVLTVYFLSAMKSRQEVLRPPVDDVVISAAEKKVEPIVPPPPKVEPPPKTAMRQFTPPRIVDDKEVKPDEKPPEQDKLDDTKIGTTNVEGTKDDGLTAPPPSDGGKGLVETPKKVEEDYDKLFTKVEIESEYPGGSQAWLRYMNKNLKYPEEAQNNEIQGTVVVQFIVDKDGNVSDVTAVSGPEQGGLREEAVRVIKKSGKWTPAVQNGRQVKSYKRQPVGFKMGE